jgi:hypothetical protein
MISPFVTSEDDAPLGTREHRVTDRAPITIELRGYRYIDRPWFPATCVAHLPALLVSMSPLAATLVSRSLQDGANQFGSLHTHRRLCQMSLTGDPKLCRSISSTSDLPLEYLLS